MSVAAEKLSPASLAVENPVAVAVPLRNPAIHRPYLELEHRIGQLTQELEHTDQQLARAATATQQLADRFNQVLNVMPVAVVLLDGRGVVAQANPMAEELLGMALNGMRWIAVIERCFSPTPTDGHEVVLRNGRLVSLATQSLNNEPGQIIVLTDLTETRRLQGNLNHHRKLSEMGKMTASLAHQIRTPLSSAILYAEHLTNPILPAEKKQKYAERIRNQLNQLDQQVRDMLIFSRGGVVLDRVLPAEALVQCLEQKLMDLCEQHQAHYELQFQPLQGLVRCNPDLFVSAFSNLVENAIQACRGAGVEPSLTLQVQSLGNSLLRISLRDNGPGIPAGLEQKILEPFFTTKATGTGLGLAVVKAIVESHGGRFVIANDDSAGARVDLTLPVQQQN